MNHLAVIPQSQQIPALIAVACERAAYRFLEFFTARDKEPEHLAEPVRGAPP